MTSRRFAALILALSLSACGTREAATNDITSPALTDSVPVPDYVVNALGDPRRGAHLAADPRRHPGEVIAFSGLKAGDRVLDLIPGDGYWTRIFSRIVGPEGRVYAVWPRNYAALARGNVATLRQIAADPHYPNVTVQVQPTPLLTASEPLDMVFTSQNYHDYPDRFMGRTDPARLNRAVFDMLKPGGTWFIVDHAATAGSGMRDTETMHRIDPAEVRRQVEAAGFEFVGESHVLANPADDHSLPVFDPAVRGRTDQFILRFRKPG